MPAANSSSGSLTRNEFGAQGELVGELLPVGCQCVCDELVRAAPEAGGFEQSDDLGSRWQISHQHRQDPGKETGLGIDDVASARMQSAHRHARCESTYAPRLPIQQVVEYHRHEDEVGAAVGQGSSPLAPT